MEPISACTIVLNEERNIRDCLESIKWVDEIVVVDGFSEDRTVAICREYTDRIFQRKWTGFYDQVSFAVQSTRNPWVLYIEADERISPELKEEILREFSRERIPWDGFSVPRLSHSLGRWIYHGSWYPDRLNRIFRKEKLVLIGPDPHLKMRVDGPIKNLQGKLLHYTGPDISWILKKMDHYAESIAHSKFQKGKTCRLYDLIIRPPARFFKSYILKAGFLDGRHGFIIAVLGAFYVFTKYIKLWELEQEKKNSKEKKK
jgi:glycosyltransferase involved in cell wall biosynthesis